MSERSIVISSFATSAESSQGLLLGDRIEVAPTGISSSRATFAPTVKVCYGTHLIDGHYKRDESYAVWVVGNKLGFKGFINQQTDKYVIEVRPIDIPDPYDKPCDYTFYSNKTFTIPLATNDIDFPDTLTKLFTAYRIRILNSDRDPVHINNIIIPDWTGINAYWESKPIKLSDFLIGIESIDLKLYDYSSKSEVASPAFSASGWTFKLGLMTSEDATPVWYTSIPSSADISNYGFTHAKLRFETTTRAAAILEAVIRISEEYASELPRDRVEIKRSNVYVPELQVTIDGVDFSQYVNSIANTEVSLALPQPQLKEHIRIGAAVVVHLDRKPVAVGYVANVRSEQYVNGDYITITIDRPIDHLNRSEDVEIIASPVSGVSEQLTFSDDLGYITNITSKVLPGLKPLVEDKATPWRPIATWKQNPNPGESKIVYLDTDWDWLQLYSTQNASLRSKIQQVAQANGFMLKSYAGVPYLVKLVPVPDKDLTDLTVQVIHMDAVGNFAPNVRFGVPTLQMNGHVPRELSIVGIADAYLSSTTRVPLWFKDGNGALVSKIRASSTFPNVRASVFDSDGNPAVFRDVEVTLRVAKAYDINPFDDAHATYKLIQSSYNGYYGVTAIELDVKGAFLTYYEYELEAEGVMIYSDSGYRNDAPTWKATGKYVPPWGQYDNDGDGVVDDNIVTEMLATGQQMAGEKKVIENPFIPRYQLPNNASSYTVDGYTVYADYADRIADMIATRTALETIVAEMPVIGHVGLKPNDVIAIARMPKEGVGAPVKTIDYFVVIDEPKISLQAGSTVRSVVRLAYMGTLEGQKKIRQANLLSWQETRTGSGGWYL